MVKVVLDFLDKQQYCGEQYGHSCSLFLLSNNGIVNNVVKAYITFNTNLLYDVFCLLTKAPTRFGLNCWPSAGSFLWHVQSKHIGALINK